MTFTSYLLGMLQNWGTAHRKGFGKGVESNQPPVTAWQE